MSDERLPKQVFYGELNEGLRSADGQKKHYKDHLKLTLKKCEMHCWRQVHWRVQIGEAYVAEALKNWSETGIQRWKDGETEDMKKT